MVDVNWSEVSTVIALLLLIFGAPRFIRGSQAKAQLEEKDRIIDTKTQTNESQHERLVELDRELKHALDQVTECEAKAREWQARYEEMSKYTAEGALRELKEIILHESSERAETQNTQIRLLGKLEAALVTSSQANGELLMKNLEVLTQLNTTLHGLVQDTKLKEARKHRKEDPSG